jgi:hypothetical protein
MPGDVAHVATYKLLKLEMLHTQLGHLNYQDIQKLIWSGLLDGIHITTSELNEEPPKCLLCALGKSTCASFSSSSSQHAMEPLQLVYSVLWGPAPVMACDGVRYIISFIDDCLHL